MNNIWLKAFFTIFLSNLAFISVASNERDDFIIKVGVMEQAANNKDKLVETKTITMNPDRKTGFCFIVDPPDVKPYYVYSVHHLPDVPNRLTGDFNDKNPESSLAGLKTEERKVEGIRPFCFDFHKGDPLGNYRVEVFINKLLKTTFNLKVVSR